MVDERLVFELTFETARVANTIPWFEADEGCILLIGTPKGDDRAFVTEPYSHAAVGIQQFHTACLILVQFHGIMTEELVVEADQAIL